MSNAWSIEDGRVTATATRAKLLVPLGGILPRWNGGVNARFLPRRAMDAPTD
jgi:hypothetical protein